MVEAKAEYYGICCTSCQENVNQHSCVICGQYFEHGDIIECENHSHSDSQHFHKVCEEDLKTIIEETEEK